MNTGHAHAMKPLLVELRRVHWDVVIMVFFTFIAITIRLAVYGHHTYSVAMNDTDSYIAAAQYAPFSWQSLTAVRPPTLPFLYRAFQPSSGFKLTNVSLPSLAGETKSLALQPGFEGIVFTQMVLSILGWCSLAWVVFFNLKNPFTRLAAGATVLIFGFSPQIADWDSILSSEALAFSLFAMLLALTIELVQRLVRNRFSFSRITAILTPAWLIVIALWIYTRDAQVYIILTLLPLVASFLYFALKRSQWRSSVAFGLVFVVLIGLFFFQQWTANLSMRWEKPFIADLIGNILPYPSRVESFVKQGMPFSQDLKDAIKAGVRHDDYTQFPDFMGWMKNRGYATYMRFLITNPIWASLQIFNELDGLFASNMQPYFPAGPKDRPAWLETIGNMFHPVSTMIIPLCIFTGSVVWAHAFFRRKKSSPAWAIILIWMVATTALLLFVNYHGDFYSKNRHVIVSLMQIRLTTWIAVFVMADLVFVDFSKKPSYNDDNNSIEITAKSSKPS